MSPELNKRIATLSNQNSQLGQQTAEQQNQLTPKPARVTETTTKAATATGNIATTADTIRIA